MNVAILGFGTVGKGIDEIVAQLEGAPLTVSRILELPDRLSDARMTSNMQDIVEDSSIELVFECMGGLEPAHSFIMQCLEAGKTVVTSNKAVVAEYFDEFLTCAAAHNAHFYIEASVGGGVPWIASLLKMKRIDAITSFYGIMNGTTNYIVDTMQKSHTDFNEVLKEAQELGYAEADPSADIDGFDVRNKTLISASIAFGGSCVRDFPVSGIRNLTMHDLDVMRTHARSIKLFGRGVSRDSQYALAVEPVAVSLDSLEAQVPQNFNLISATGATVGPLKFYGQGAGKLPTGNAMVQDALDFVEGIYPVYQMEGELTYNPELLSGSYVVRTQADLGSYGVSFTPFDEGYLQVQNLSAAAAHELLNKLLKVDPSSFMMAYPQE